MELKPCPFCGEKARLFVSGGGVCVKCVGGFSNGCGAQTDWLSDDNYVDGMDGWRKTKKTAVEKAIFTWNRRVDNGTLPAADVAPVRHGFDTGASRYFRCSECGYGVSDVFEDGPTFVFEKQKEWSYCPNCGADMREADHEP